jgi:guanine deaminase
VLLDMEATPLLAQRTRNATDLDHALFAMFILGDDRAVQRTYVHGRCEAKRA